MSKLAVSTLFVIAAIFSLAPDTSWAQVPWQQTTFNNKRLTIEVGAKVYDRPGVDDQSPVLFDTLTNSTLITSEQATDFGSTFGAEIKAKFTNRRGHDIEFRTLLTEWDEEVTGTGANLGSFLFPPSPIAPESLSLSLEADYYSFGLNRRRSLRPGVTIFGGPRFVSTSDELAAETVVDAGIVDITQLNEFEAKNSFFGLQGGIEVNRPIAQAVSVTGFFRGGGYFNSTEINTSVSTSLAPLATTTRRRQSTESFIGEAGGRVNFQIIPDSLQSFIGYEATWIDGIALSAANIVDVGGVDTSNTIFFQAVTFGFSFTY